MLKAVVEAWYPEGFFIWKTENAVSNGMGKRDGTPTGKRALEREVRVNGIKRTDVPELLLDIFLRQDRLIINHILLACLLGSILQSFRL
jgi:hypothetical protein